MSASKAIHACVFLISLVIALAEAAKLCGSYGMSGWIYNPHTGSSYLFGKDHVSWFDAASICRSLDSTLVQVDNADEQSFITEYVPQHSLDFGIIALRVQSGRLADSLQVMADDNDATIVWGGMNDLYQEGLWRWQGSNEAVNYTNGTPGEPNNSMARNTVRTSLRIA
jgi:hypothetical protein